MKLIGSIKPVKPEDFAIVEDGTIYSYVIDRGARKGAIEVDEFPTIYTEESLKEYAKQCVVAALKEYVAPYSDKKAAAIVKKVVK